MTADTGIIRSLHDARPVFVVGPSRSGTKLTMRMLRQHPDIFVSAETHYFDDLRRKMNGRHRSPLSDDERSVCENYFLAIAHTGYGRKGDPTESPMSRTRLRAEADAFGHGADAYFAAFCSLQASEHGKSRWGEKTPRHAFCIGDMLACFPHAKVLGLVRDPRAVIASYRDNAHIDDRAFDSDEQPRGQHRVRWQRSYDLVVASLLWRSTVNHTTTALTRYGRDRIRIVRYEDLVTDPVSTLRDISAWLDIEYSGAMIDVDVRNSTYVESGRSTGVSIESMERWRQRLSVEEIATIQTICRRWMEEYSYALQSTPAMRLYMLRSWLRLPFSAARATFANRDRSGPVLPYIWRRLRGSVARPPS